MKILLLSTVLAMNEETRLKLKSCVRLNKLLKETTCIGTGSLNVCESDLWIQHVYMELCEPRKECED